MNKELVVRAGLDIASLGDLDLDVDGPDALYDALVCPRCGGSGEVPEVYTNGAGYRITDSLPCPDCARPLSTDAEPPY